MRKPDYGKAAGHYADGPMWSGEIVAYMISTPLRDDVRRDTIANLAATDWAAAPVILLDEGRFERPKDRVSDLARSVLVRALDDHAEVFVFLEDDLDFNRFIRSNLEHWPPLVERAVGSPFFASLYNPNVGSLSPGNDGPTYRVVDPELTYGAQGLVMSATTAVWILHHWNDIRGLHDTKMPRLAAQLSRVYYHRPSLVQHRPVPSLWGGVAHAADDFLPDWCAD
jgi:hypothetical protein